MSGGHFQHNQYSIHSIVDEIKRAIEINDSDDLDDFGQVIGNHYSKETIDKFKEAVYHLECACNMVHRIDYLLSGDDGEDSFTKRWDSVINNKRG